MNWNVRAIEQLKRHEGFEPHPYRCTAGKLTIGYGRNLDAVPLTETEAEMLLLNDLARARFLCRHAFPGYGALSRERQGVVVNMVFNMGLRRVLGFKRMVACLQVRDYPGAAREMLDSKWAAQVGARADELAEQMRENKEAP